MTWNGTPIQGGSPVSEQKTRLNQNATYTETYMKKDHYWNESANSDGHHKLVQFVPEASAPAVPSDDAKLILYSSKKAAGDSPTYQAYINYLKDVDGNLLELLGLRAVYLYDKSTAYNPTYERYNFNINTVSESGAVFTVTFNNALPSRDYLVLGGAVPIVTGSTALDYVKFTVSPSTAANFATDKTVNGFKFRVSTATSSTAGYSATLAELVSYWFIVFGG